jgi:hypothetical protein
LDSLAGCLDDNDSLGPDDSASNIAAIVTIDDDPMVFYHEVERMRSFGDVLAARAKRKASRTDDPSAACAALNDNTAVLPDYWVADTGSPVDLIGADNVLPGTTLYPLNSARTFNTANGRTRANNSVRVDSSALGTSVNPLVLENTPPVLSIGQRVIRDNWKFEWTQSAGPVFTKPDGATIQMSVKNFVPIIVEDTTALVVEASATPSQWEDEGSTTLSDNWSSQATKAPSDEGPRSILKSVSRLGNILPYFGPAGNREPQPPHRARGRPRAASPAAPTAPSQRQPGRPSR